MKNCWIIRANGMDVSEPFMDRVSVSKELYRLRPMLHGKPDPITGKRMRLTISRRPFPIPNKE